MATSPSKPRSRMSAAERKRSDAAKRSAETRRRARSAAGEGVDAPDAGASMAQLERRIVEAMEAGIASVIKAGIAPQFGPLLSGSAGQITSGGEPTDGAGEPLEYSAERAAERKRERMKERAVAAEGGVEQPTAYIGDGPISAAMGNLHDQVQMLSEEAWNMVHALAPILDPADGVDIDSPDDSAIPLHGHLNDAVARVIAVRQLLAHTRGRIAL